ncbi:MAG: thymidylate synthase [Cyanobacteria bacterium J06635_10]
MSSKAPLLIEDTNLSHAWGRVFLHIIDNCGEEISPLVVTLTEFNDGLPDQDAAIVKALDECLTGQNKETVSKFSERIFPSSMWELFKNNRQEFFSNYIQDLPNIKAVDKKYRPCLYFERLIAFSCEAHNGNQLEHIISEYKSRPTVRKSMLQASIFDPARDHVRNAQLGFPCLGHISFVPNNDDKTLVLNAFYATQQIFSKAYGNYLGLCKLGHFMAYEMGLTFERMNCFVGVEKLDEKINKKKIGPKSPILTPLIKVVREALESKTESRVPLKVFQEEKTFKGARHRKE